jgi:hypothetical protein
MIDEYVKIADDLTIHYEAADEGDIAGRGSAPVWAEPALSPPVLLRVTLWQLLSQAL